MDVLVLIDKLDDVVHNARPVPLTDQVRVDREEIYDLLDQMRATIPEEIKQARWIVKERQEMLAEAKREAERIVREAGIPACKWGTPPPKGFEQAGVDVDETSVIERLCVKCAPMEGQADLVDQWRDSGLISPEQHAAFLREAA